MNRRQWLSTFAAALPALAAAPAARQRGTAPQAAPAVLDLKDFQPRSMLAVPATRVPRARVPVIDFHTHLGFRAAKMGVGQGEEMSFPAPPAEVLAVMDRVNLKMMVNLTGGVGSGLQESIKRYQTPHPDRFITFAEPRWSEANRPGYAKEQADDIERARKLGARGVKVLKTLGLYLREQITAGPLVAIDDRRFDPMWEACAAMRMPVAIHIGDPAAFFLPIDRFNERFEELNNHPDWSFHGRDFPTNRQLLDARNRVFARHPKTTFVALHVGHNAEDLGDVSASLDRHPNMHVEMGARVGELGRQPRTVTAVLRSLSGPHPLRHRRDPARDADAPAGLRRGALRDLFQVPGNRGRVLRLRAGADAAAGPLADLRHRAPGADPAQGVPRQRGAGARAVKEARRQEEGDRRKEVYNPLSHDERNHDARSRHISRLPGCWCSRVLQQRADGDRWHVVGGGQTDADGRLRDLLAEGTALVPGVYRLIFDTQRYFDERGVRGFYPHVIVVFEATAGEAHYHVPLLLGPFGYTTYRGT